MQLVVSFRISVMYISTLHIVYTASQCMGDRASSERWHCTLQSCEPTCQYNGNLYPVNTIIDQGLNTW